MRALAVASRGLLWYRSEVCRAFAGYTPHPDLKVGSSRGFSCVEPNDLAGVKPAYAFGVAGCYGGSRLLPPPSQIWLRFTADKELEEKLEKRDFTEERNSLTEKKRIPMYRKGGQMVRNSIILPCGNYNGVLDFTKVKGPAEPIPHPKAYEKCFQSRMIHNLADRVKQLDGKPIGKWESYSSPSTNQESGVQANVLRPLSPHLPIYKPHVNSTLSILNRISGSFLTVMVTSFYLIYLKLGPVCLSFENFYQFLFYSSKLTLISLEMTALALAYHVYAGVGHLRMDFSGSLIGKSGRK